MNDEKHRTVRVFFALWPTPHERDAVAAWQPVLRDCCQGREMRADTLHVTLVFVGEIEALRLEALAASAGKVRAHAFELTLDSLGYWQKNHILYAKPSGAPRELFSLVGQLERQLERDGFSFDRREYQPHLTLFRNVAPGKECGPNLPAATWQVREFVLVRSLLEDQGARYQVLARFPLHGRLR